MGHVLSEGKKLSKLSEHQHDSVKHRTIDHEDPTAGHMEILKPDVLE